MSKEEILSQQTGISIHRVNHDTCRCSDAIDAMETYSSQQNAELQKLVEELREKCNDWVNRGIVKHLEISELKQEVEIKDKHINDLYKSISKI